MSSNLKVSFEDSGQDKIVKFAPGEIVLAERPSDEFPEGRFLLFIKFSSQTDLICTQIDGKDIRRLSECIPYEFSKDTHKTARFLSSLVQSAGDQQDDVIYGISKKSVSFTGEDCEPIGKLNLLTGEKGLTHLAELEDKDIENFRLFRGVTLLDATDMSLRFQSGQMILLLNHENIVFSTRKKQAKMLENLFRYEQIPSKPATDRPARHQHPLFH